jgi:O-antigen/teichoic acid export membrane protein
MEIGAFFSCYKVVFSAYFARAITVLCKFFMIPLLIFYLSPEEYAALVIVSALEGWFLLLDFGVGSSLQNHLVESFSIGEKGEGFLKTAFLMGLISFAIGLVLLWSGRFFFARFLFENVENIRDKETIFFFSGLILLGGTFGSLAGKILMAQKKGHKVYLLQSLGSILSLLLLLVFVFLGQLSLKSAIFICLGVPALVFLFPSCHFFRKIDWKKPLCLPLLARAKKFWIFSCFAACITLSDTLIAAKALQMDAIIEYNLLCKLFGIASFIYSAFVQALMPECTALFAAKNYALIKKKIWGGCALGITFVAIFSCFLCSSLEWIEGFTKIFLPKVGVILFSLYVCIRVIADFHAMALQSASCFSHFSASYPGSFEYFFAGRFGLFLRSFWAFNSPISIISFDSFLGSS